MARMQISVQRPPGCCRPRTFLTKHDSWSRDEQHHVTTILNGLIAHRRVW